jgi:hypothetical protein
VIDDEVVAIEPAGDRATQRDRLDHCVVTAATQLDANFARAVRGVGIDLAAA